MRQEHIQRTTVAIRLKNTVLGCKKVSKLNKNIFVNFRAYFICIFSLIVTFNHHVTTYIENHIFLFYFLQKTKNCNITVFGYKKGSNSKSDNWKKIFTQKYGGFHLSDSSSDELFELEKNPQFWGVFAPPPQHDSGQFEGLCLVTIRNFLISENMHFWSLSDMFKFYLQ